MSLCFLISDFKMARMPSLSQLVWVSIWHFRLSKSSVVSTGISPGTSSTHFSVEVSLPVRYLSTNEASPLSPLIMSRVRRWCRIWE